MAETWTVQRVLAWIESFLEEKGDANPRVSARWLVSSVVGVQPIELYADLQRPLSEAERATLREYTKRRASGEPLQYITGSTDFRFVSLHVEPGVLIPRPETEVLVSEALEELWRAYPALQNLGADIQGPPAPVFVADICTGSGCIAASVAHEVSGSQVWASDISPKAVHLARRNVHELGLDARVVVAQGDLCQPLPSSLSGRMHLVVSNPPYIPQAELEHIEREVSDFEPTLALDGGNDGLDVFRALLPQAYGLLCSGGVFAVELHETCLDTAASLAQDAGFAMVRIANDLANRPRVLVARA